ncbi:MAG: hypothetical protein JSW39_22350 [Desulfobacterales bacterium]|nr:MAG: hypothetical protein JSW39_22350 [Desulfobacterales bacterium]
MCQSLVTKVAQFKQLQAVTDPEILMLFEDWLEELENEVAAFIKAAGSENYAAVAQGTGLSQSGAKFIVTKLKREGRI